MQPPGTPQVRSHAQKYFLKLEKSGKANVVPPPRPKKRAAKPYPVQVRPTNASHLQQPSSLLGRGSCNTLCHVLHTCSSL